MHNLHKIKTKKSMKFNTGTEHSLDVGMQHVTCLQKMFNYAFKTLHFRYKLGSSWAKQWLSNIDTLCTWCFTMLDPVSSDMAGFLTGQVAGSSSYDHHPTNRQPSIYGHGKHTGHHMFRTH